MYTRSRRARASLQMSLWADAVAGSARTVQRRREMGWKYREGAGQSTTAMYAAEQAERRRQRNRRKTQAITAAIVLGVTVPAWAVVNAVSTPSAHNGLATVSDGTPLPGADATDDQLGQMLDSTGSAATDGGADLARAKAAGAAHQFDLPWATDVTTAPAPAEPAAKRAAVAPEDTAGDDAVTAPDETATVPDQAPAPEHSVAAPEATNPEATNPEAANPEAANPEDGAADATTPEAATPADGNPVTLPGNDRASLNREGVSRVHKHVQTRPEQGTKPTAPAPAAPAAPSGPALAGDPADPTSDATTTTPAKPAAPTKPVTPAKPAAGDPAAPAAAPATSGAATAPTSDSGGGATKGEGKGADSKPAHGHVAKSDPAAP